MRSKDLLREVAKEADIRINGDRPWDVRVYNEDFYDRVIRQGTLGLGESYMDGWWDCDSIDAMICRAIAAGMEERLPRSLPVMLHVASQKLFNFQTVNRAAMVAEHHYNADPALFQAMLDPYMQYSCACWTAQGQRSSLAEAQVAKMDLICRKLHLEKGMEVLDVGCGWGGLACHMAESYGVRVTGITVSREQATFARQRAAGTIPDLAPDFRLEDYRSLKGTYDRVVSVGMFEHVGRKNYAEFFDVIRRCLRPDGLFLLHTIGSNGAGCGADPWLTRYIFPNGILPSPSTLTKALEGRFVLEDWHNFGADYDKTLLAWHENFQRGCETKAFACDERTRRMFSYYLLSCAGASRARSLQLWQLVLSPEGVPGGYRWR